MDEIEELMYKVIDEDYDLTERDKNYLTISSFVLAKEKIIKKDIPKKKVYFDCNKQEYIPLIIELGNIIKNQIIRDGKSLDQTVSVELTNEHLYKGDKEELKKAVYYVHRLRDWLVHKDCKLEGNKVLIKPFASDINHTDKEYTIEVAISDIEKICKISSIDFVFDANSLLYQHNKLKDSDNVVLRIDARARFVVNVSDGLVMVAEHHDYEDAGRKLDNLSRRLKKEPVKIPSHYEVLDLSDSSNGKLDFDIFMEIKNIYKAISKGGLKKDLAFKLGKSYSAGEALLRNILQDLGLSEHTVEKNNYYISALYNYAVNVYGERDKNSPDTKHFNLNDFKVEKITNQTYDNQNKAMLRDISDFNDHIEKQKENMKHVPDPNKLVLLMFNDFSDFYDEIGKHLEIQKGLITKSIRNSIDHGNITIDPITSKLVLYDLEDNNLEINDDNCKTKLSTNIESLHNHLDEYKNGIKEEYTLGRMIKDLKQLTNDSEEIIRFEKLLKEILNLATEREVDIDNTTLLSVSKEVRDRLIERTTNVIRTIK